MATPKVEKYNTVEYEPLEGKPRKCAECGKPFCGSSQWAYKTRRHEQRKYFCSWTCMRAEERREEKPHERIGFEDE